MLVKVKTAGILLLIMAVCSISSTSLLTISSVRAGAGTCPMHQQSSPRPSPIDHHCCQSGHDTAVLQTPAHPSHELFVLFLPISGQKSASPEAFAQPRGNATPPGTPPAKFQLRV